MEPGNPKPGRCRTTNRTPRINGPALAGRPISYLRGSQAQFPPGVTVTVPFLKLSPFVSPPVIDLRASAAIVASYASIDGSLLMTPAPLATLTVWPQNTGSRTPTPSGDGQTRALTSVSIQGC